MNNSLLQNCEIVSQKEGTYNVKKGPHQGAPFTFLQKMPKIDIYLIDNRSSSTFEADFSSSEG